jgi:hypothetical protein
MKHLLVGLFSVSALLFADWMSWVVNGTPISPSSITLPQTGCINWAGGSSLCEDGSNDLIPSPGSGALVIIGDGATTTLKVSHAYLTYSSGLGDFLIDPAAFGAGLEISAATNSIINTGVVTAINSGLAVPANGTQINVHNVGTCLMSMSTSCTNSSTFVGSSSGSKCFASGASGTGACYATGGSSSCTVTCANSTSATVDCECYN